MKEKKIAHFVRYKDTTRRESSYMFGTVVNPFV